VLLGVCSIAQQQGGQRIELATEVASSLSERWVRILSRLLVHLAVRETDVALLVFAYERLDDRSAGISRALSLILKDGPSNEAVSRLDALPVDARARWCLSSVPADWVETVVDRGASWLRQSDLSDDEVISSSLGVDHGVRLLSRWLDEHEPVRARGLLAPRPDLRIRLIADALNLGHHEVSTRTLREALDVAGPELVTTTSVIEAMERDLQPAAADEVMLRIARIVVPRLLRNSYADIVHFVDLPSWRRWTQSVGAGGIAASASTENWRDALTAGWSTFEGCFQHSYARGEAIVEFVACCFRQASTSSLDRTAHIACKWFKEARASAVRERLAAEAVVAVRRVEPYSSTQWLEACFYVAYAPTYHGTADPFRDTTWPRHRTEWDHAHPLREWLVRLWADRRWPADMFLTTLSGDRQLLNDCLEIMRYRYGKWEFTQALMEAARSNRALMDWVQPLEHWYYEYKPKLRGWW